MNSGTTMPTKKKRSHSGATIKIWSTTTSVLKKNSTLTMVMTLPTKMVTMNGTNVLTRDLVSNSIALDGCTSRLFQLVACKTFFPFQRTCLTSGDCFSSILGLSWSGSASLQLQILLLKKMEILLNLLLTESNNFIIHKYFLKLQTI